MAKWRVQAGFGSGEFLTVSATVTAETKTEALDKLAASRWGELFVGATTLHAFPLDGGSIEEDGKQ